MQIIKIALIFVSVIILLQGQGSASQAKANTRQIFDQSYDAVFQPWKDSYTYPTRSFYLPVNEKDEERFNIFEPQMESFNFRIFNVDLPPLLNEIIQAGRAFATNFVIHELGHKVLADEVGAKLEEFNILKRNGNELFLGVSTFREIDEESKLSYSLAGEVAADLTFEHALQSYRRNPSIHNRYLMFFSGTDFLWYCAYSFYMSDGHEYFDPVAVSTETGISKEAIFSIALAKTLINAYRVYSGKDLVIPHFSVSRNTAMLNFRVAF